MKLSKLQREELRNKFGGRCAYCGAPLGERWHADHLVAVERQIKWISGIGAVATGKLYRPENDTLDNMMPSCPPCNIDKHSMTLEGWRRKLQDATNVLTRNNPTYRHAKRFGLIAETGAQIHFFFESYVDATPYMKPLREMTEADFDEAQSAPDKTMANEIGG